jgi:SAM-dependent methyltransferase
VPDFPLRLSNPAALPELERVLDREAKIPAALEALGSLSGSRLLLVRPEPPFAVTLIERFTALATVDSLPAPSVSDASVDVIVAWFDGIAPVADDCAPAQAEVDDAERILAPGGRLLVVHDYGRDELTPLEADAEAEARRIDWSRPKGWFLARGFKVRVLHCWLTFDSMEEATAVLGRAFDRSPASTEAQLRRPRVEWKVAVYHRTMGATA